MPELPEQRQNGHQQRILLGVAAEVVGDAQRARHVAAEYGLAQLEIVVFARDADVPLDVAVGDALRPFGQRDEQFFEFVGDLRHVASQVVGQHRQRLLVDTAPFRGDESRQPRPDLVVARPHRLEDRAAGGRLLVEGRTLVDALLLVADDEDRRRLRLLRVERELLDLPHLLRLLQDHYFVAAHHRHLAAEVDDLPRLRVAPVEDDLVERPFGFAEDRRRQTVAQRVDEIGLVAHEQVDRSETAGGDIGRQALELRHRIPETDCTLSHSQMISLVIRKTFSVRSVRR